RHRDAGKIGASKMQPFRFRNWVYTQAGTKGGLEEVYKALRATLPDHIGRNVQGSSMAELLFHIFYTKVESALSTVQRQERPKLYAQKMAETMARLENLVREYEDEELESLLTISATDRSMVVSRMGDALWYRSIEGIE